MRIISVLLLVLSLSFASCATTVPVAVDCSVPAPLPQVLTEPVSTPPSLLERYDALTKEVLDLLEKAKKQ